MNTHVNWEWSAETIRMIHLSLHDDLEQMRTDFVMGHIVPREHWIARESLERAKLALGHAYEEFAEAFRLIDQTRASDGSASMNPGKQQAKA